MRKFAIALIALATVSGVVLGGIEVLGIEVLGIEVLANGIEVLSETPGTPADSYMESQMYLNGSWQTCATVAAQEGSGYAESPFPFLVANGCRLVLKNGIEVLAISTFNGSDWE